MATMRLELARTVPWLSLVLLAGQASFAWSQSQTTKIRPSLDMQALATDNATIKNGSPQSDVLLTVTPGISISTRGAYSELEGAWRFSHVRYTHQTQSDRTLPSGNLNARLGSGPQGLSLDAGVAAEQTRSQFTATNSATPSTQDTYTDYRYRLSPQFAHQFDSNTTVLAKINRTWVRSERNSGALVERPDSRVRDDGFSLTRQPTPFGFGLDGAYQSTIVSDQPDPTLTIKAARGRLLYALSRELEIGAIAGRETTSVLQQSVSSTVRGAQFRWTPGERTLVKGIGEDHAHGQTWQLDATHRSPWMSFGFQSRRSAETSAAPLGTFESGQSVRSILDAMLSTRITNKTDRARAVDDIITQRKLPTNLAGTRDLYDLSAQMRQVTTGRLAFMGRRHMLILVGGMSKSIPLRYDQNVATNPLLPDITSSEYFLDTQLTHQLTRLNSLTGGLRWSRAHNTTMLNGNSDFSHSREFSWRASLDTQLTPDTTATYGLRRQITHLNTSVTSESVMFVGLGYRF
ncbi:MAG: TIGR03016 family PEP-CTERM system-associated outer membrane protein [Aquabacterium sp.]|uniref:TIGR03016 family PEP-CTERM system-associated outer membrane protein n=1 Tax=Aquabacterium sp. TaxID=1872578 RepID=UPI0025BD7E34|nr:TIGR03016 family PEP-CTERM system-associated outer membrane protein [Aquabacterium sp.]MBI5926159.1 TIGR03016 family PEP-CTERM system-associated outer membrane protein [Aquabacterium sp.]